MSDNPFLAGKLAKRKRQRQRWLERQMKPDIKDWAWALKFASDIGLRLVLKRDGLDDSTVAVFLWHAWQD